MRERFDGEYIRSELVRIGDHLEAPLTVYLIGGGSMAFRDLKEATKDIDPEDVEHHLHSGSRDTQRERLKTPSTRSSTPTR